MKPIIDLAVNTLGPVLYALLLGGAVLGLLVGVMLLADSARLMRWNSALNGWYSSRRAMGALDRQVDVKPTVYRWHRVFGVVLLAGALFTLDILVFGFKTSALVRAFRDLGNPALLSLVFEALRIFLIVGNVAGLVAAGVLVFRPSLLKGLEAWSDRQYSGREATERLDTMRFGPDNFVRTRPRLVGTFLVIGSLYVLVSLSLVLL
jgi:hypothetical protein